MIDEISIKNLESGATRFNVNNGILVPDESGWLTLQQSYADFSIRNDNGVYEIVLPKDEYRGRKYRYKYNDCAALVCRWIDRYMPMDKPLFEEYSNLGRLAVRKNLHKGFHTAIARMTGYTPVERSPEYGDVVAFDKTHHLGICIGDGVVLHHPRNLLSCTDKLDKFEIFGVFSK